MKTTILIKDKFYFEKKSKHKASDGLDIGKYPFFTSSPILNRFINDFDYNGEYLIFGTGGNPSMHYCNGKFSTSTDCIGFKNIADKEVFTKYIFYFIKSNSNILENGFHGAGLKHISSKYINNIKVPLPPIETQKQIAYQLEKVEQLKELRQQNIDRCDELIKSIFYDLFGDPVKNEKGWEINKLGDICDIKSGGTPLTSNEEYWKNGNIPWIGSSYCKDKIISTVTEFITQNGLDNSSAKLIPKKTTIIALVGATKGKTGYLNIESACNQNIAAFLPSKETINSLYLFYYLQTQYEQLTKLGQFKMINLSYLKNLKIIVPSINIQNEFAKKIKLVARIKDNQIKSKNEIDNLFNSLMQNYFNGGYNG